ncbi:MAG: mandelate racemase/muconate lactonizing enzyme family protein [Planctomycetaceae bacterium]
MPRITAIETAIPRGIMSNLLLVRVHTDDGLVGCGETYYTPHAIAALVHDWMAARLLGADALAIESHWRWLYERCTPFGHPGAERRALSALDLALWDILGQATGQPVYRLLGGPVRESIPVYNTCGGPSYGAIQETGPAHPGWPGYGSPGKPGKLEDAWASLNAPGELAAELVAEGYKVVKLWPFDAAALREIEPLWLEDVLRVDCVATLADFRRQSGLPIAASEMLLGRKEYLQVLQAGAADYCMVDPTWNGGISETRRVIDMAQTFNVPATIHDCTGPLTLFAGLHLAASSTNVVFQESVRAHVRTLYRHLVDRGPVIEQGMALVPEGPGLGTRFHDALFVPGKHDFRRSDAAA